QEFSRHWDCRFLSFETWLAFKRRQVYSENWIQWDEMEKLKNFESYEFLTQRLQSGDATLLEPGHPLWWASIQFPNSVKLIQAREHAALTLQHDSLNEGLSLIGTPERDGRPS